MRAFVIRSFFALSLVLRVFEAFGGEQAADVRKEMDLVLQRQRTEVTLILYSQVIVDLLEQGLTEKDGVAAKARAMIDKTFEPAKIFERNRACLAANVERWGRMAHSGEYASTRDLLSKLLSDTGLDQDCRGFLGSVVGTANSHNSGDAHTQFLVRLEDSESLISRKERKLAHLDAAYQTLVVNGQRHLGAAERIAAFYSEDQDTEVKEKALGILQKVPGYAKAKTFFSIFNPDMLMVSGPLAAGSVRLVDRLARIGIIDPRNTLFAQSLVASAIAHLGVGKLLFDKEQPKVFEVEKTNASSIWDRSLEAMLLKAPHDLLTKQLLDIEIAREVDRFARLGQDDYSFGSLLIEQEINRIAGLNPIEYANRIEELEALSAEVGKILAASGQDEFAKINAARKRIFQKTPIKKYRRDKRYLLPFLQGEGGNCVANTKLMISLLWPQRHLLPRGLKLGVQAFTDHVQPVLYSAKGDFVFDLVSGKVIKGVLSGIFHPAVFLNGYLKMRELRSGSWNSFLIASPGGVDKAKFDALLSNRSANGGMDDLSVGPPALVASGLDAPEAATIGFNEIDPSRYETEIRKGSYGKGDRPGRGEWEMDWNGERAICGVKKFVLLDATSSSFVEHRGLCYNDREGLGYVLAVKSEQDRKTLESLPTDSARADYLEEKILGESSIWRSEILKDFREILRVPTQPFRSSQALKAGLSRFSKAMQLIFVFEELRFVDMLRSGENYGFGDQARMYRSALRHREFREWVDGLMEVYKIVAESPERLAKIIDDPQVPSANKIAVSQFLKNLAFNDLSDFDKADFMVGRKEALRGFDIGLSNRAVIGISEKLELRSRPLRELPSPILTGPSGTVRITERIKGGALFVSLKPPKCMEKDAAGRCRNQEPEFQNQVPAKVYVSPQSFFKLVNLLPQYSPSRLSARWGKDLEKLYLETLIENFSSEWKLVVGDPKLLSERIEIGFLTVDIPRLARMVPPPVSQGLKTVKIEMWDGSTTGGGVTAYEWPVSPTLFAIHECTEKMHKQANSQTAPKKSPSPSGASENPYEDPINALIFIRDKTPMVMTYLDCLKSAARSTL